MILQVRRLILYKESKLFKYPVNVFLYSLCILLLILNLFSKSCEAIQLYCLFTD